MPTSIHPNCINKHWLIATKKQSLTERTHTTVFFFSLKVTQCTKSKSGNSKILGSIKNFLSLLQVWIRKQCTYLYWASALLLVGQPRGKLMQISNEKKPAADPCPATTAAFKGCWHWRTAEQSGSLEVLGQRRQTCCQNKNTSSL